MTTTETTMETGAIRHEVSLPASPQRVYELLTDGAQFASATGKPAEIGSAAGAEFTLFGGHVQGRQLELVPGERVVQAWRSDYWEAGVYSVVRFTLAPEGAGTRLTLNHDAYPEGASPLYPTWREHLATNWPVFYFQPLANFLAA